MKKKRFPIKDIRGNLVLTQKDKVFAYYKVSADFVMSVDSVQKKALVNKIKHVLDRLKPYGALDIRLMPRDMTLDERLAQVVNTMPDYAKKTVEMYCHRVVDMVQQEMGRAYVYEWYIGVPLTPLLAKQNGIKQAGEELVKGVMDYFGYGVKTDNWTERYDELEQQAYIDLSGLTVSRLSREDMMYLTRLNFIRNMPHTIASERINDTIEQVCEGVIDFSALGQVHLGNYTGESYIASLPLASTDDVLNENYLAELVTRFDFPIELQYQVFYEDTISFFGGLKTKAENNKKKLKNITAENYEKNGEMSKQGIKTADILDTMLDQIEEGKDVFVGWTATLVIYADSEKQLTSRAREVIEYFNKQHLHFVRGLMEQYTLFMQGFFGQIEKHGTHWYHISTVRGFAENLLFTHNRVGTKTGFYFGRVDANFGKAKDLSEAIYASRNVVLFNPTIINKGLTGSKTDSPHIVVTGETGKGKSFLINYIHFYLSFFTKSIYIDVKNEKKMRYLDVINDPAIQKEYPYLVEHIQEHFTFVTLDADEAKCRGVLDPILFLKGSEAKGLAETILHGVYNFKDKDTQARFMSQYLNDVIREREEGGQVGLMTVIEKLITCDNPLVRDCGLLIQEKIKGSVLQLVFGDEHAQALSFETKHTILGFKRLDLPDMNTPLKAYTASQYNAMLIMYALGYFSKVFGSNPHEFTVTYIDEAWLYFSTAIGKGIMREMKRVGRSYNNALVLGTQSVKDFVEDDKGNFGTFFAFDEPSERPDILKHLGLPVSPINEIYLENLIKGQCLYLDNYGRCQKITVHCPFEEVVALFKTVDKTNLSELERQFV